MKTYILWKHILYDLFIIIILRVGLEVIMDDSSNIAVQYAAGFKKANNINY